MPLPLPTVDELVETLKHSRIPTVLVEGPDDMTVYRWIEDRHGASGASVLPCGGRSNLLQIFKRKHEFPNIKTAFVADQDLFYFLAVPLEYKGIIWTSGYSIENDIISGSTVLTLLDEVESRECAHFAKELARWFAFEVAEARAGRQPVLDVTLTTLFAANNLCPRFLQTRNFRETELSALVHSNWTLVVRGKLVLKLLLKFLADPARPAKHSSKSILEIGTKLCANPHLEQISFRIQQALT